jgi:hypothetical protein
MWAVPKLHVTMQSLSEFEKAFAAKPALVSAFPYVPFL